MRLWVDGDLVHEGDLFDTRCRWALPHHWCEGPGVHVLLELRSPCHDDGALITSALVREPRHPDRDPQGCLLPEALLLAGTDVDAMPESWLACDPDSDVRPDLVRQHLLFSPTPGVVCIGSGTLISIWLGSGLWPIPGRPQNARSVPPCS